MLANGINLSEDADVDRVMIEQCKERPLIISGRWDKPHPARRPM